MTELRCKIKVKNRKKNENIQRTSSIYIYSNIKYIKNSILIFNYFIYNASNATKETPLI